MDIKNFHINKYNEYKHDKEIKTKCSTNISGSTIMKMGKSRNNH